MERWLKVVLGTVFGSIGCIIFYLLFDRLLQYLRRGRGRRGGRDTGAALPLKVRHRRRGQAEQEELESLVYEEYDTERQEVLAISREKGDTLVGIAVFLSDREVEYYWEQVSEMGRKHENEVEDNFRNLMTAVSHWAPKWTYAEAVNFLISSGDLVRSLSKPDTVHCKAIEKYEERHSFRFFIQWTDNYVCDEVANEELWEEVVNLSKMLLNSSENELESAWDNFPLSHWKRKRVKVRVDPHPGEVSVETASDETENLDKVAVTDDLVKLKSQ